MKLSGVRISQPFKEEMPFYLVGVADGGPLAVLPETGHDLRLELEHLGRHRAKILLPRSHGGLASPSRQGDCGKTL